jgi:hypothetical protein
MTHESGASQTPESGGGPKRDPRRLRVGSAAKFWAGLAVILWLLLYFIKPAGPLFAWLFFVWFFGVALVALFFQNLWAVAGGSRLETNVAAWIASIVGVMTGFFIIKHNLGPAILGGLMMGR